jgi:DNA transposition AAA+ family ATPase
MNKSEKTKVAELLRTFCDSQESQNKAARMLKDVSPGMVSLILNGNWTTISEKKWQSIATQVGFYSGGWVVVETYNYKVIRDTLLDAKRESRVHAIIGGAGWGKDAAAKDFATDNDNVWVINCAEYFNNKHLMIELLRAMGKPVDGTIPSLVERAVKHINQTIRPLVVFNEFDKLKDEAFYFFITIYNQCEDKCAIVAMSTDQLEKRIQRGLFLNKKGYQEIFSRFGRRFIELKKPSKADVAAICRANGVDDQEAIMKIYNDSEGDLRRVKKLVQNHTAIEQSQTETDDQAA